jgi:glycosyltransferase involved in cell wall biosynthesis
MSRLRESDNHRYRFTVFTPTYNRAHTLLRVYESLKRQTFRDFEWLIVDDGSTDNTRERVERWRQDNLISIRYFWQPNSHKKTAFNRGVTEARGELFLTMDSDDEAMPNALESLNRHWMSIPDSQRSHFSAVTGLCIDTTGEIVGSRFPADVLDSDTSEVFYRYGVVGEKWGFQRSDILRQFPFPEDVDGYVPEGVVWSAIAAHYKTRFINEVLRIYHNENVSITREGTAEDRIQRHADGHALWAREVICNEWRWFLFDPKWFLKMAANYTRFHLHLQKLQSRKRWPLNGLFPRMLVMLMWPVGVARYELDIWRRGMS